MSNYSQQPQDMYQDNHSSRSPGSHRHPPQQHRQLHRQSSRQFDAYGSMPSLYDEYAQQQQQQRYDPARPERMPQSLPYGYDMNAAQTWSSNGLGGGGANTLGSIGHMGGSASTRMKPNNRARTGLPATWLDQPQQPSMPNAFPMGPGQQQPGQMRMDNPHPEAEDELIPTAIVIKNIPFAVKKEQLIQLMTELNLPLPYAFNYHFDNGIFRGLAFANFTSPEETAVVIDSLNHFDLQGRKLRVEYKKMLPLQERERIEREKRERRGQLEEQHRPMAAPQLNSQNSMSSLTSHMPAASPSPVSQRPPHKLDVDMNDSQTLTFYSELLLFKRDPSREVMIYPASLTPSQRRTVHTLSHNMGLCHVSHGSGDQRQVHVLRSQPGANVSPPMQADPASTANAGDPARRGLNRAATIDFSEARSEPPAQLGGTLRTHNSGFLNVMDNPSNGFGNPQNLRAAKSFADLRSFTPSPVPSSASFPAALQTNGGARLAQQQQQQQQPEGSTSGTSNTPTLTPTPGSSIGMQQQQQQQQQRPDDNLLLNSFGGLSLGTSVGGGNSSTSPRRLRGMFSWEQQESQPPSATTAPIGSNRSMGVGFDQSSQQDRVPMRQPRGPAPERGTGFRRQNGHQARGSDELRNGSNVEIIVE